MFLFFRTFPSCVFQPASRWQMRILSAPRRAVHSVHVHSPSPSNLELPRQTQGAMHCTPSSPKCYAQGTPPKRLRAGRLALMGSHVRAQCRETVHHAVVHPVEPAPGILLQQGVHHMAGLRVQLGGDRLVELQKKPKKKDFQASLAQGAHGQTSLKTCMFDCLLFLFFPCVFFIFWF